jgi:hypothetical protein
MSDRLPFQVELKVSAKAKQFLIEAGYLAWPSRADPLAIGKAVSKWLADKAAADERLKA